MPSDPYPAPRGSPREAGGEFPVAVVDPAGGDAWLRAISSREDAVLFHHPAWARVLVRTYGFRPFYLMEQRPEGPGALLPVMEVRTLRGRRKGVALPFTDTCPMLLRDTNCPPDPALLQVRALSTGPQPPVPSLYTALRKIAEQRHWSVLELRLGLKEQVSHPHSIVFYNHTVPLAPSDETQLAQVDSAARRCLRKCQSGPLQLSVGAGPDVMKAYYALHCLTRRRQGAPPQPWNFFENITEEILSQGRGYIVLASLESKPVAGAVFFHHGRHAMYKFGASDLSFQHLRPNHGVMWTGLRHAARVGVTSMDLGRTSLDNDGLRRFKAGWGAVETRQVYHCLDLATNAWRPLVDRASGWQSHLFRRLPSWLNRSIGRMIYRFAA